MACGLKALSKNKFTPPRCKSTALRRDGAFKCLCPSPFWWSFLAVCVAVFVCNEPRRCCSPLLRVEETLMRMDGLISTSWAFPSKTHEDLGLEHCGQHLPEIKTSSDPWKREKLRFKSFSLSHRWSFRRKEIFVFLFLLVGVTFLQSRPGWMTIILLTLNGPLTTVITITCAWLTRAPSVRDIKMISALIDVGKY